MTREEQLDWLCRLRGEVKIYMPIEWVNHFEDALTESIKALSQEPCDAVSRESVNRILRDMGVNCAYDMPSFWANKGKDYKVIPTKWHKGYQQAVADFDKRINELPSVTQKSDVLDKIRDEIEEHTDGNNHCDEYIDGYNDGMKDALEIIDKYMERSDKE